MNTEDIIDGQSFIRFQDRKQQVQIMGKVLDSLKSVWLRRPGRPFDVNVANPKTNRNPIHGYIENQWHVFLEGLEAISDALWINNPHANRRAENKINQLKTASSLGFTIPNTCITSSKAKAIEFFSECKNGIVAKALDTPLIEYPDRDYFIFTNEINSLDETNDEEFRVAPTIFQERIIPKIDYRVTVIGNECFTVRAVAPEGKNIQIDWRASKDEINFVRCDLPKDIVELCIEIVNKFGLVFGAIDLVESEGKFYFLEINPNGEWGWLQKKLQIPIAKTISDYLIKGK
ncbi:MAG: hypothetical protein AB1351_05100 [Thermoproteota archaeon]